MNNTPQTTLSRRAKLLVAYTLTVLGISTGFLHVAHAEEQPSTDSVHLGVANCANTACHGRAAPVEDGAILQNEYRTWAKYDHHSRAYTLLKNEDSRRIANNMGIEDASEAHQCLACHADTTPKELQGEKFQIADGIGCEVCHGGAEQWIDSHYGANTNSTAVDSFAAGHQENLKNGLSPTEDPSFIAVLCQSCHLGNTNQLANHEMMAAGHPRLRFELDTWLALMPPHHKVDADYKLRGKQNSATSRWLAGRIQAAQDSLTLLEKHSTPQGLIPELAIFDCHSCHRPMDITVRRSASEKQLLPAGAMRINDNALRMLAAIVSVRDKALSQEFSIAIRQLNQATMVSAKALHNATDRLMVFIDTTKQIMSKSVLSISEQQAMTIALLKQGASGEIRDYADAEQLFLALQLLYYSKNNPSSSQQSYEEIFLVLNDEKKYTHNHFKAAVQKTLNSAMEK